MEQDKPSVIVVRDEAEAFEFIQKAVEDEFADRPVRVKFEGWPVLKIRLEGDGYESTITSDMAEALVVLQQTINRAYARVVRQESNSRVLTNHERQLLQFKAKVEKGSSLIEINLGPHLETIGLNVVGKMEPAHLVMTIVGLAAVSASALAYKWYLKSRTEGKDIEEEARRSIAMSQEETRRLEIMARAIQANPQIENLRQDFDDVRREILKGTADASKLTFQGVELDNRAARRIAAATRSESRAVQLNGHYRICKIDWEQNDRVRLWVENTDSERRFVAMLKVDEIDEDQRSRLQQAEWGRRRVYLSVNATELRGEITTATIVGAEWPAESDEEAEG